MTKKCAASPDAATAAGPLIGIPIAFESADWRVWSGRAYLQTPGYVEHVRRAGGIPVLLPLGGSGEEAARAVQTLDGLLLPGGPDVHPDLYGQQPHPAAGPFDTFRDDWEGALITHALAARTPVLGICRGAQLINVVLGGSLIQHLPDVVASDCHNPVVGAFATHAVRMAEDSHLAAVLGITADVPTYHHQAVDAIAAPLRAVAWATDGTVEALEGLNGQVLAVQWHPEVAESNALIAAFVAACALRNPLQDHSPPPLNPAPTTQYLPA
ncbi:gamma-glutamyl-gamma-aminobutyrate hydrolase family protein [Mycolicibacterium helvum]|uniref:Gamma-glutamyl-gamma-aminobutyrate hydrolase n=1 Tax=Mycolicibacterium helvum TaxID=1534349 RepID=A0A7I7T9P1_9MYCO|nr:gamma-glutamyl-gamma-aminobutyrate hydrolase family protein [Mycolicibacterium helvum]BBY65503.1 gamma-glutamyl-gamma-aminobutyrate hydrolase [Mycolicibacterium helvum]